MPKEYHQVIDRSTGEKGYIGTLTECREYIMARPDNLALVTEGPITSAQWLRETDLHLEYWDNLEIQRLLSRVPREDRGWLALAIVVGRGQGAGAESWREYAKIYLRAIQNDY